MLVKKLSKHGNSLALVIDKPILELLGIDENTELVISTNGEALVMMPERTATPEEFEAALARVNERYGPVLKRLAE